MKNIRLLRHRIVLLCQFVLCIAMLQSFSGSLAYAADSGIPATYFTIKNRWNNAYLVDDGTDLHYKVTTPGADTAYQWSFVSRGGPYYDIKNRKTGDLINIEKLQNAVQSDKSAPAAGGDSSMWAMEQTPDGYFRLRNGWHIGDYLHIQDLKGYVQHGMMSPTWESAQWQITQAATETAPTAYFSIKNRWNNAYLVDDGTDLHYKATTPGADTAYQWSLVSRGGPYYDIKNRKTGDLINIEKLQDAVQSDKSVPAAGGDSSKWAVEKTPDGYFRLRNGWHIGDYLHIQDLKGYVQHGMMYPVWESAQWQITRTGAAYTFRSVLSNKCFVLDATRTDTPLKQVSSCDVNDNSQVWILKPTGNRKEYSIVAVKNNQCLDAATQPLKTAVCNPASATQVWKAESVTSSGQEDKRYRFRQGQKCLAISTAGGVDQLNALSLVACDNGNNQIFTPIKGGVTVPPNTSSSSGTSSGGDGGGSSFDPPKPPTNQPSGVQPINSISALDFGVVGDGRTDNQVTLQKAIDAAKAQGKTLWIPAGIYNHSGVLTLDGVKMQGAGNSAILNATNPDLSAIKLTGSNSSISNLKTTISAPNRSSMPNACAILVVGTSGASVHHLVIQGAASNGVRFDNVSNSVIYSNLIMGTNADGVELTNGSTSNTVKNNVVYQAADMSYADYSFLGEKKQDEHNTFDGNLSLNNTYGMGFSLAGAKNDTVQNNIISGSLWYGIWADSDPTSDTMESSGNMILNNTVINNPNGAPVKATGPGMMVSGTQTTGSVPSPASILGWDPGSLIDRYTFSPSYKPGTGPGAVNTSGNRT